MSRHAQSIEIDFHEPRAHAKPVRVTLLPTNVPGVFTFPPPPHDLNVEEASPETLIKHGLAWCLPRPGEKSVRKRAALQLPLRPGDWVMPRLEPSASEKAFRRDPHILGLAGTSPNWAGSVVKGQWDTVEGQWTVPTVGVPPESPGTAGDFYEGKSWVGIDGWTPFGTADVFQAGVNQRVNLDGSSSCTPWFEWFVPAPAGGYPGDWLANFPYINPQVVDGVGASPGDVIFCNVSYVQNKTMGLVWFRNVSTNKYASLYKAPPPTAGLKGVCVEWVMEASGGGYPVNKLPSFSPVTFTSSFGSGPGTPDIADPQNGLLLNIQDLATGVLKTSVSAASDTVKIADAR
jgi:hypothetical protein